MKLKQTLMYSFLLFMICFYFISTNKNSRIAKVIPLTEEMEIEWKKE